MPQKPCPTAESSPSTSTPRGAGPATRNSAPGSSSPIVAPAFPSACASASSILFIRPREKEAAGLASGSAGTSRLGGRWSALRHRGAELQHHQRLVVEQSPAAAKRLQVGDARIHPILGVRPVARLRDLVQPLVAVLCAVLVAAFRHTVGKDH